MVIYCIENIINNKCYIGQTIQSFKKRKIQHLHGLRNNKHGNNHLQNSWNKYGKEAFDWYVLENDIRDIQELNRKEANWIKSLNLISRSNGYNLDSGGNNNKRSKETIAKITKANKGKVIPEKMRKYLSIACSGWNHTEEAKIKISKKGSKHPRSIFEEKDIIEIRNKYSTKKYTQLELADEFNCSKHSISNIVLGKSWKHVGGPTQKPNSFNKGCFKKGREITVKEKEKKGKLKALDVLDIRNAYKLGCFTHKEIANAYYMSQSAVTNIINNKVWKNI